MSEWTYENPRFECDEINKELLVYAPWSGHRNFIYDFVKYYKPQIIVELGSHYGCSSFAILQSIKDHNTDTEFYGVDTWEGDSLTIYGEKEHVYESYKKVNDTYFKEQKSRMLRMTFDEAVQKFENHSIDVLHIDGSHEYDDVKHDYRTWKEKVKEDGIILFHDVSEDIVVGEEMGSHIFWEELKKEQLYTFEFDFSFGLGILFFSKEKYADFKQKVDMQKYQRINNELAVNYKDEIRKQHFKLLDEKSWISSLQKEKECLEKDNERLIEEKEKLKDSYEKSISKMREAYEKTIDEKENYNKELQNTIELWKQEVEKVKHDYEKTIKGKDEYIASLEQRVTSEGK